MFLASSFIRLSGFSYVNMVKTLAFNLADSNLVRTVNIIDFIVELLGFKRIKGVVNRGYITFLLCQSIRGVMLGI